MVASLDVKDYEYDLYSDASMAAARAFGIAFQVDAKTIQKYLGYGIDLAAASGREHFQLPVPSVFLVARGGRVEWVYSNDDYKVRPDNASLLAAATRFSEGKR